MYGGSKESGAIVGKVESATAEVGLEEVGENTGCEESLQCTDADGNEMTLSARLDSGSGALVWSVEDSEEEVQRRVLSTNQMTSMLHDEERNRVYERAIKKNVAYFSEQMGGRKPTVLDVGAGTGLLSMMAARAGAEGVVGCEMYAPMAAVAEQVVIENGMDEKGVQIIPNKSTDVDGFKVDLLVSELLDSALLGESCVFSHADAIERLIAEESDELPIPVSERVIPHSATIYGKLVESAEVEKMVSARDINLGTDPNGKRIGTPWRDKTEAPDCKGGWPLIPVHWSTLKQRSMGAEMSAEGELLRFDLTRSDADDTPQSFLSDLEVKLPEDRKEGEGTVSGLLVYWRLDLLSPAVDPKRECFYTTRPDQTEHWQDHWVQCIFPLARPIQGLRTGDVVRVSTTHNNLNIWFDIQTDQKGNVPTKKPRRDAASVAPIETPPHCHAPAQCTCGWHVLLPTDRMLMLNDDRRQGWFAKETESALERVMGALRERERQAGTARFVLDVGDSSVLALRAAMYLQQRQSGVAVVSKEAKLVARMLFGTLGATNGLEDFHSWDGLDFAEVLEYIDDGEGDSRERRIEILALIGDQYQFQLSAKPVWQALSFHYQRTAVAPFLAEGAPIVPGGARLMAACFELVDLHVSHGINGTVSGFDHSHLDKQQRGWQRHQLPYKLADYRKRLLCAPAVLQTLDFTQAARSLEEAARVLPITAEGRMDCLAIWVDYASGGNPDGGAFLSYSSENYPQQAGLGADFPPYYKVNLLFAADEERRQVAPGTDAVHVLSSFQLGESDFAITFDLRAQ